MYIIIIYNNKFSVVHMYICFARIHIVEDIIKGPERGTPQSKL